jgi:hypothetical protein
MGTSSRDIEVRRRGRARLRDIWQQGSATLTCVSMAGTGDYSRWSGYHNSTPSPLREGASLNGYGLFL